MEIQCGYRCKCNVNIRTTIMVPNGSTSVNAFELLEVGFSGNQKREGLCGSSDEAMVLGHLVYQISVAITCKHGRVACNCSVTPPSRPLTF